MRNKRRGDDNAEDTMTWPTQFKKITFGFGKQMLAGEPYDHKGVDIKSLKGDVYSMTMGQVIDMQHPDSEHPASHKLVGGKWERIAPRGRGWAAYVVIRDHVQHLDFHYRHVKPSQGLQVGDWVKSGAKIGTAGNYGLATAPHLHLELYRVGKKGDAEHKELLDAEKFLRDNFEI